MKICYGWALNHTFIQKWACHSSTRPRSCRGHSPLPSRPKLGAINPSGAPARRSVHTQNRTPGRHKAIVGSDSFLGFVPGGNGGRRCRAEIKTECTKVDKLRQASRIKILECRTEELPFLACRNSRGPPRPGVENKSRIIGLRAPNYSLICSLLYITRFG